MQIDPSETKKKSSLNQQPVNYVTIDDGHEGQRIDNFLITYLKGLPKSHLYRILRKGEVRVNKKRVKPDYRLQAGDVVRIPPLQLTPVRKPNQSLPPNLLSDFESRILYEDDEFLVFNKPAGLPVHGGTDIHYGVIETLRVMRPKNKDLELVHRLDKGTSGCLMIAKKRSMLKTLHALLREGEVQKQYLALLAGRWQGGERCVDVALRKNQLSSGERIVKVDATGKAAVTWFEPEIYFKDATFVAVRLETGRTHQIRVHAAHIHHPIAGDDKYGDRAFNKKMRAYGCHRLFLHAAKIQFKLPETRKLIAIEAPLDSNLKTVIENLKKEECHK